MLPQIAHIKKETELFPLDILNVLLLCELVGREFSLRVQKVGGSNPGHGKSNTENISLV